MSLQPPEWTKPPGCICHRFAGSHSHCAIHGNRATLARMQRERTGQPLVSQTVKLPNPDFVIFGIPSSAGGVQLFASKELTRAELEQLCEQQTSPLGTRTAGRVVSTALVVEFPKYTMVIAATYPEAVASLFDLWNPPSGPPPNPPFELEATDPGDL